MKFLRRVVPLICAALVFILSVCSFHASAYEGAHVKYPYFLKGPWDSGLLKKEYTDLDVEDLLLDVGTSLDNETVFVHMYVPREWQFKWKLYNRTSPDKTFLYYTYNSLFTEIKLNDYFDDPYRDKWDFYCYPLGGDTRGLDCSFLPDGTKIHFDARVFIQYLNSVADVSLSLGSIHSKYAWNMDPPYESYFVSATDIVYHNSTYGEFDVAYTYTLDDSNVVLQPSLRLHSIPISFIVDTCRVGITGYSIMFELPYDWCIAHGIEVVYGGPNDKPSGGDYSDITDAVNTGVNSLLDLLSNVLHSVLSIPSKFFSFFNDIGSRISGFYDSVGDWFAGIPSSLAGFFSSLGDKISQLPEKLGVFFSNLGDKISQLSEKIGAFFVELGDILRVPPFVSDIYTWITGVFDSVRNFFNDAKDRIFNFFGVSSLFDDEDGLFAWLSDTSSFVSGLTSVWDSFSTIVLAIPIEIRISVGFVFGSVLLVGFLKSF